MSWIDWRGITPALGLGLALFLVTLLCLSLAAAWSRQRARARRLAAALAAAEARAQAVQQAEAEALGRLTGGIAHDFNNLLTVILGSCEAAALELGDPRLQPLMEMALQAGEQCAELVRQLLAFARRQTLAPQAFDLGERIAAAAPSIIRTLGPDIQVAIRSAPGLPRAFADPLQTESAIRNLCRNARDAMPQGGRLLIETAEAPRRRDLPAGDFLRITVSDTGTGIAPDVLDRIFDPFFTTKGIGSGTGLGLSAVQGFAAQSGGHVEAQSRPGQGTQVHLYLPVAGPGEQMAARSAAGQPSASARGASALVLEASTRA